MSRPISKEIVLAEISNATGTAIGRCPGNLVAEQTVDSRESLNVDPSDGQTALTFMTYAWNSTPDCKAIVELIDGIEDVALQQSIDAGYQTYPVLVLSP